MEYLQTFAQLMQGLLPLIMVFIAYALAFPKKNFETRLQVKKDAFLEALNILDAQTSYYFKKQGALLQKVEIEDVRATFSKLLICTDNPEISKKFAEFFSHKKSDPESGESHLIILNQFRNLIRKELGLTQIDFKSYPFENNSYFLYVGCAKENKHAKHNQTAELK
ncbi:MAG: hypothetical protein WCP46_01485 [Alphaproteobacteria bacterium]|jgi:hypothetical protein